jgi:muconolactone delta-isomerase
MKLLALEINVAGVPDGAFTDDLLRQEAARVWQLCQSGTLREIYFRADRHSAILVLECTNVDEAKSVISTLPLVQHRLIEFDIIPLKPYPGIERLFDTSHRSTT